MKSPLITLTELANILAFKRKKSRADESTGKPLPSKQFVCTDPDRGQYGRWLGGRRYEFKEQEHTAVINLNDYSDSEIDDHISAYYTSVQQITDIYGDFSDWIIAECIFENQSPLHES